MIQTKRGLLLVAVVTIVIALIVLFPARIAYRWASPSVLAVSGIHGTVWRGRADAIAAKGIYLRDVSWGIKPLHFLTAKAAYRVRGSPESGFAEGIVGLSIGGAITVSDLAASVPLRIFAEPFNIRGLQGNASLQFERIKLRDGLPVAADGTVRVDDLLVPQLSRDPIGGYRADVFTQNNGVSASIEDTDGMFDLAGSLQLKNDRSYEFLGQVIAKPETPANLRRQMKFLGPANDRGQQELRVEGSL